MAGHITANLLTTAGLSKVYGKAAAQLLALDDVTLSVRAGEFVAIMGPSGSGKSTFMNIIGCLDLPTRGQYRFADVDVTRLSRSQLAILRRHYIGFVFQGFNLLSRTTALENVELPLVYRRLPQATRREMAKQALQTVLLEQRLDHMANELSVGQQQRVAIARAIVTRPALLLADEPTGNLDSHTSQEIMALLSMLNKAQGITILMVTHDADVAACARRVVKFVDGRIASDKSSVESSDEHADQHTGGE